jgi:uncharacterized protein YoxC
MASKSQLILHVATEAIVIASVSIFFTKKINTLSRSIDEMASHLQTVTSKLEEQEKMIQLLSEKLVHSEITRKQKSKTPVSSPVFTSVKPPPQPVQDDVILLNIFNTNSPKKSQRQNARIEVMEDDKSPEKLDSELTDELLDLEKEMQELTVIPEEEEIVLKDESN